MGTVEHSESVVQYLFISKTWEVTMSECPSDDRAETDEAVTCSEPHHHLSHLSCKIYFQLKEIIERHSVLIIHMERDSAKVVVYHLILPTIYITHLFLPYNQPQTTKMPFFPPNTISTETAWTIKKYP